MRKLILIIFISLLWSGNTFAENLNKIDEIEKNCLYTKNPKPKGNCINLLHSHSSANYIGYFYADKNPTRKSFNLSVGLFYAVGDSSSAAISAAKQKCEDFVNESLKKYYCHTWVPSGIITKIGKRKKKETVKNQKSDDLIRSNQISLIDIKNTCMAFGYKEGSEKLADCMKEIYLKQSSLQQQNISKPKRKIDPSVFDDLNNISKGILNDGKSASEAISGTTSSKRTLTCFRTGEETGGLNKICRYDCAGSIITPNIGSSEICPIQIQK